MAARLLMGKDWGKEMSKHSQFHIYLRLFLKAQQKASYLPGMKSQLAGGCGFFLQNSKSKEDIHQMNHEPDYKLRVSGLTADDATQRDPASPQCGASTLPNSKRYLYRNLVTITNGCDSWGSRESRGDTEVPTGKEYKRLAGLVEAQLQGNYEKKTQPLILHKESHLPCSQSYSLFCCLCSRQTALNSHISMEGACSGLLRSTSQFTEEINSREQKKKINIVIYLSFHSIILVVVQFMG